MGTYLSSRTFFFPHLVRLLPSPPLLHARFPSLQTLWPPPGRSIPFVFVKLQSIFPTICPTPCDYTSFFFNRINPRHVGSPPEEKNLKDGFFGPDSLHISHGGFCLLVTYSKKPLAPGRLFPLSRPPCLLFHHFGPHSCFWWEDFPVIDPSWAFPCMSIPNIFSFLLANVGPCTQCCFFRNLIMIRSPGRRRP